MGGAAGLAAAAVAPVVVPVETVRAAGDHIGLEVFPRAGWELRFEDGEELPDEMLPVFRLLEFAADILRRQVRQAFDELGGLPRAI